MKTFWMLLRREFWEHRALWLTPLLVAALILLGLSVEDEWQAVMRRPGRGDDGGAAPAFVFSLFNLEALFFVAAALVAVAYLMDCLYAERRDRSILFWRSLPLSDRSVVLSKFAVATVAMPLFFYVVAVGTSLVALEIQQLRSVAVAAAAATGVPTGIDWGSWLHLQGVVLYAVVASALWYAPYAAYLMLVSSWARSSVLAWAVTPPLLVALLERMLFDTTYVGGVVQRGFNELYRLAFRINQEVNVTLGDMLQPMRGGGPGGFGGGGFGGGGGGRGGPGPGIDLRFDPSSLLASPQLWLGLLAAALMLWGAMRLRERARDA